MYKKIDARTKKVLPDKQLNGKDVKTSPWWNVREHSAASMRIYKLSGDKRHLTYYEKAQNASYKNYPNAKIDWLMFQTLNPDTGAPLPLNPATANLDPLHDQRARDRETKFLAWMIAEGYGGRV